MGHLCLGRNGLSILLIWTVTYVLHVSRYSGFEPVVLTNTGACLRGLKLCGESRTQQVLLVCKKKIGDNHPLFSASIWKRTLYIALYFTNIVD